MDSLTACDISRDWKSSPRWTGIERPYTAEDVLRLRGSIHIEHTLARIGAERLWKLLNEEPHVPALGALTGNQAVQQVKAGLKAIYLVDGRLPPTQIWLEQMYPDQSLYPAEQRAHGGPRNQQCAYPSRPGCIAQKAKSGPYWFAPIVADAEAGFGGPLNAFELMKAMIEAGAAAVHFEDQLASAKKCGHMGGKVLVPASSLYKSW